MRATLGRPEKAFGRHLDNHDIITGLVSRGAFSSDGSFLTTIGAIDNWDRHMANKTYRIELKINFGDDTNHEIMLGIAKQYARDLLGSAMLLQDGRKPAVALMTDDAFHGIDEIDLLEESNTLHT